MSMTAIPADMKNELIDAIQVIALARPTSEIKAALIAENTKAPISNAVAVAYAYFGLHITATDQRLLEVFGLRCLHDKEDTEIHRNQLETIKAFRDTDILNAFWPKGTYKQKRKRKHTVSPLQSKPQPKLSVSVPPARKIAKPTSVKDTKGQPSRLTEPHEESIARPKGLNNPSGASICYMNNSLLQYLYRVRLFRRLMLHDAGNRFVQLLSETLNQLNAARTSWILYPMELPLLALTSDAG